MTTAEERLAALQAGDPTTPAPESAGSLSTTLTALVSRLDAQQRSIEKLVSVQNSTTAAVNLLVEAPAPDPSAKVAELSARVAELSKAVEALAARPEPEPRAGAGLSETQLERIETAVRSATEPVVGEDGRARTRVRTDSEREAAKELRLVLDRSEALTQRVEAVAGRLSWDSGSWFKAALLGLPYAVVLVMLLTLVVPVSSVFGIPALSAWAWESFGAADSAWGRGVIVVAVLAVIAGVVCVVYRGGKWLAGKYEEAIR